MASIIDAITIPVGLVGLYFWIKLCIAILKAKAQGEGG